MSSPSRKNGVAGAWPWLGLYTAVIALFFFEHLFLGRSLLPLDLLNQMLLPRAAGGSIEVQTHYGIDQLTQLWPNLVFWRESVQNGEFPLWNPHFLGGHPHHGATGWTLLGIFKLPLLLPGSIDRICTLTSVFEFWLAGIWMFFLLGTLGRSRMASFIGACSWALCSNFLLFHWIFLCVFVWVPLLLLCWERTWRTGSLAWGCATSCVMAIAFLGGSVQMVAFVGFLWGIWSLGTLEHWTLRLVGRWCGWAFGIFGVAAMLCAAQWLPTFEFLPRETQRLQNLDPGSFGWKHALLGPWVALIQLFVPAAAGSPQTFDLLKLVRGSGIDFNGYVGVVPAFLGIVGLMAPWDRRIRNLVLLIVVVTFMVFFTPLQKFLYHRFLLLAVFAVVLISARGVDALLEGSIPEKRIRHLFRASLALGAMVVVVLFVAWALIQSKRGALTAALEQQVRAGAASNQFGTHLDWLLGRVPKFLDHYAPWNAEFLIPAVAAGLFGFAGLRCLKRPVSARFKDLMPWILILSIVDLSWTLRSRVSRVDPTIYPAFVAPKVLDHLKADRDWFRIYRWMPQDKLTLMDNLAWGWGYHQLSGYESMSPDGMSRLPLDETNGFNHGLELCSVKYVLASDGAPMPADRFELVAAEQDVRLYRNRRWIPPVQWVREKRVVESTAAAVELIRTSTFDPSRTVVLTADAVGTELPASTGATGPKDTWVRVHDRTAQRLSLEVSGPVNGHVVFSETWFPGWKGKVDGVEVPVLRADAYLQTIAVGAGIHQVEFRFEPSSFQRGKWISMGTLLGVLCVGGMSAVRSKSSQPGGV